MELWNVEEISSEYTLGVAGVNHAMQRTDAVSYARQNVTPFNVTWKRNSVLFRMSGHQTFCLDYIGF